MLATARNLRDLLPPADAGDDAKQENCLDVQLGLIDSDRVAYFYLFVFPSQSLIPCFGILAQPNEMRALDAGLVYHVIASTGL